MTQTQAKVQTVHMSSMRDPGWCVTDAVLADGGTVHIRPITPEDGPLLLAFHDRLSDDTIHLRFFSAHRHLQPAEVERFTRVDHVRRMALVAVLHQQIIAVARYDQVGPEEAEVAFVIEDAHQGRGLGTLLLEYLAAFARARGIRRFVADTLVDNMRMRNVFRDAGFVEQVRYEGGVVRVNLDIEPTEASTEAIEHRWQRAAARSVERILRPRSIAVIGASRERGTIGHEIFRNLLNGGFNGPVYPVHPTAPHVASVPAYSSVNAIPNPVDLAVVVVPAEHVLAVIEECGAKGVRGLVVISAGFAETGGAGAVAQKELVAAARGAGMRLVGPNCMGVINTAAGIGMNATFAPTPPIPGRLGFLSQSGGLGIAVLEEADRRRLGLSSFVSVGNKADVSGNDLLRYWQTDDGTDVILLYLESFGNPRQFARVARQVSRTKPIVAVKAGRTVAGSRAASSHTAALASPDVAVDALFAQTGVIRVDTLQELFEVAQVLSDQPLPAGRRVGIVTNSGGPGILAADACEANGLVVPELAAATQAALREFLSGAAGVRNPVDLVASGSASDYERTIRLLVADENVDAVVVVFTPPLVTEPDDVASAVAAVAAGATKPIIANFVSSQTAPEALTTSTCRVPCFAFPESAVRALARAAAYRSWRDRPAGRRPELSDVEPTAAKAAVQAALASSPEGGWLEPPGVADLLGAYRIALSPGRVADSPEEAVEAAADVGYPVVLKVTGPDLIHKSDVGGVRVGLRTPEEVLRAFRDMRSTIGERMDGVMVQPMAAPGVETLVGLIHDQSFGPLVVFGSGGTSVELFEDRSLRVLPLTDLDAAELVRSLRSSPLLFGYRGAPPVAVTALEDLLLRVGRLAEDIPEIAEMDLNPVIVSPSGVVAVDAKLRLAPAAGEDDPAVRRLR
jgi:acetyl coenzyme A synthetase (ADP forming)-like protein